MQFIKASLVFLLFSFTASFALEQIDFKADINPNNQYIPGEADKDMFDTTINEEQVKKLTEGINTNPIILDKYLEDGQRLLEQANKITNKAIGEKGQVNLDDLLKEKTQLLIFVSFSIPDNQLKSILEDAYDNDATVLFRGIKKGNKNINANSLAIKKLYGKTTAKIPNIYIDSPKFKLHDITSVPTYLYASDEQVYIKSKGIISSSWVLEQYKENELIDLGVRGQLWDIEETDLIEEMQKRALAINWDKQKKLAVNRFWKKNSNLRIQDAKKDRIFEFDPSVVLTKDIPGANNIILAKAGDKINPQLIMPLTKGLIFIDGSNEKHVIKAKELIDFLAKQNLGAKILISKLNHKTDKNGWDELFRLEKQIGSKIFLINDAIKSRFRISKLPSLLVGTDDKYRVYEYDLFDGVAN